MDPHTALLLTAITTTGLKLVDGIADSAGGDAWNIIKEKVEQLTGREKRVLLAAFDKAVKQARDAFLRRFSTEEIANELLAPIFWDIAEGRIFRQMVIEEMILSVKPNLGRLLDYYRRHVRFAALLQGREFPQWSEMEPALYMFFGELLPRYLEQQSVLHPLLLKQHDLEKLNNSRVTTRASEDMAASLRRIEALLRDMMVQKDGEDSSTSSLQDLYQRYQGFVVETIGTLDFRGIMQVQNVVRLQLEDVYTPLKGKRSQGRRAGLGYSYGPRQQNNRIPLHDLVRDTPFLVLLGDPGAGKSTLVRYILLSLAEGCAQKRLNLSSEWLPILFPVAAFSKARSAPGDQDLSPLDYLSIFYKGLSQPDYKPLFLRALETGRAFVLFDGLDEVREDRLTIVKCLESFVREWDSPGNRFVATSRIVGYDDAPLDSALFVKVIVQSFDDQDIRCFIRNWSMAFERAGMEDLSKDNGIAAIELDRRAESHSTALCDSVFASSQILDMARNPLLLTILALIHNQGTKLPDRRVDLYRLCVEALAETWNRARSLSGREIDVYLGSEKLDTRFVVNLLGPAALWIHGEQPGGLVEQDQLERLLTETLVKTDGIAYGKAQRLAIDFINLVRRDTGLLREVGHRRYSFLHLTFEEYLAARALIESVTVDNPEALIQQHSEDPGWHEVIRLAIATTPQREAQRLLLHLLSTKTSFEKRDRPVILAAECLLDIGRNNATTYAWNAVAEQLLDLFMDPAKRPECEYLLDRLGHPPLLDPDIGEASLGNYWCKVSTDTFWYGDDYKSLPKQLHLPHDYYIARYLVTNLEYARFIEDGGYTDQRWWTETGWEFVQSGSHRNGDKKGPITLPQGWNGEQFSSLTMPVVGVSWYEAVAYCKWLTFQGHQSRWLKDVEEIRLPTSPEWERAARSTDKRVYPWGNVEPDITRANYNKVGIGTPSSVYLFPKGAAVCGAVDMVGNVWEWTATTSERSEDLSAQRDLSFVETSIVRGGSYKNSVQSLYCGISKSAVPYYRSDSRGFRIVWVSL